MLFAIAFGGAVGSLARYWISGIVQRVSDSFPYGTLVVNVLGSFLLGVFVRYFLETSASSELRAGLTIGFCGGFTTFSAFSYETARLLEDGSTGRALIYVLASLVLSVSATFLGFIAARAALASPA